MNRVEELTLKLADGDLAGTEAAELTGWLAKDPVARLAHLRLLEIEGELRARHCPVDVAAGILSRLVAAQVEQLPERVLARIKADTGRVAPTHRRSHEPHEELAPTRPRHQSTTLRTKSPPAWMLTLTASVVVMVSLSLWFFGATMGKPVLAQIQGTSITVERGTEFIPATVGMALRPGDVLRTGTNDNVTVGFGAEPTQLRLAERTELTLASVSPGKRFKLEFGKLDAAVARQRLFGPMILTTPNAQARVLGTKFTLTATNNSTRLDVDEGEVRFTRAGDRAQVDVPANYFSFVAANAELTALPQTGWIFREYWSNLPSTRFELDLMFHPSFPDHPNGREWLTNFETPRGWGENYGARWRGYLHPPITGDYQLTLAAADEAALYLSKNDQPQNRIQVQWVLGGALDRLNPDQDGKLNQFTFIAGRRYYIEALHKAGKGVDYLSLTWKRPDGKVEVIPGEYLSPFKLKPKEMKP